MNLFEAMRASRALLAFIHKLCNIFRTFYILRGERENFTVCLAEFASLCYFDYFSLFIGPQRLNSSK